MEKVRLGIIGVRNNGKFHVKNAAAMENVEITALADMSSERLAEAKTMSNGNPELYNDADQLISDPNVDAVVLSLPNHLHAPFAIKALDTDKDVLVEKPISMNTKEAEAMIAARDRNGKHLMVGMNQRFNKQYSAFKKEIKAGTIGDFSYGKTRWTLNRPFEGLWGRGDWFLSKENSGGGPLIDLGIHRLDLALYFMGFPEVESVNGAAFNGIGVKEADKRQKEYGIEDGGIGFIRFKNGACLVLEAAYFINDMEMRQDTFLYGSKGGLSLTDEATLYIEENGDFKKLAIKEDDSAATSCVEHFVNVLTGKEELIPTAEQGLTGIKIIEAIYQSAETGKTIIFN